MGPDICPSGQKIVPGKPGDIILDNQIIGVGNNVIDQQQQRHHAGKNQENGQKRGTLVLKPVPDKPDQAGYDAQDNQQHTCFCIGFQTQQQETAGKENCRDQVTFIMASQGEICCSKEGATLREENRVTDDACEADTFYLAGPDVTAGIDGFSGLEHKVSGQRGEQEHDGGKQDDLINILVEEIFAIGQDQNGYQDKPGKGIPNLSGGKAEHQQNQ